MEKKVLTSTVAVDRVIKIAFNVVRDPDKIIDLMKKSGFYYDFNTGEVFFHGVDTNGNYIKTEKKKAGADLENAIGQQKHIIDNLIEKTMLYSELNDICDDMIKNLTSDNAGVASTLAREKLPAFVFKRAKDVDRVESSQAVEAILGFEDDVYNNKPQTIVLLCKSLKRLTTNMVEKWQAQADAIKIRSDIALAVRKQVKEDGGLFVMMQQLQQG